MKTIEQIITANNPGATDDVLVEKLEDVNEIAKAQDLKDEFAYYQSVIKSHPVDDAKRLYMGDTDMLMEKFDNLIETWKGWVEPEEKLEDLI